MVDAGDARTTTDISTAAQVLGLSIEALRKRLQRGRMEGFKAADGTWRVVLDAIDEPVGSLAAGRGDDPDTAVLLREIRHLDLQIQTLAGDVRSLEQAIRNGGLMAPSGDAVSAASGEAGDGDAGHPGMGADAGLHAVKQVLLEVLAFLQRRSA
jgi:hypothetical protein